MALVDPSISGVLRAVLIAYAAFSAYAIRLFAVQEYGRIIHDRPVVQFPRDAVFGRQRVEEIYHLVRSHELVPTRETGRVNDLPRDASDRGDVVESD